MHEHRPDACWTVTRYCATRSWEEGASSRKEKNGARRGERGPADTSAACYITTKGALDAGSTVAELAEILLPCILSRGIPRLVGRPKHLVYAEEYVGDRTAARARTRVAPSIAVEEASLTIAKKPADRNPSGAIDEEVCAERCEITPTCAVWR